MKTSDKVRRFLAKGMKASEIAKRLDVKPGYVHTIKWLDKKKKPSKLLKAVKQADREIKRIKLDKKAQAWAKKNPWWGVDEEKTAYALGLHEKLVNSGVDPRSDEYYKKVDAGMKPLLTHDFVNNPPHYTDGGIDTLSFIEAKDLNFRLGNVVKYVSRAGKKLDSDPIQDLEKARFYLEREIEARRDA